MNDAIGVLALLTFTLAALWGPLTATYASKPGRHRPEPGRVAFTRAGWDDRTTPIFLRRSR